MRRGPAQSIVANPVLVGAVTLLVVVVAVFLAYNANNGLPFVPTKTLFAELPNGADLNKGVEVREGGYRIGVVDDLKPGRLQDGSVGARVRIKLDESAGPFPKDSKIVVRPRSPLALKIVQFERGRSREGFADGDAIPADQSEVRTDLDELYDLYDAKTREGVQGNLLGFGNAFAGRGVDLNTTIARLPEFLGFLRPVMSNLADERTDLPSFFKELGDAARIVAPVSREYARSFRTQADTFDAINRDPDALQATISKSPATIDDSVESFREQRPLLRDTAALSRDLNLASRDLRAALPPVNRALEVATPVTARSVELNDELVGAFGALRDLATAPTTNGALRGLTATMTTLNPTLRFVGPYITVCNYWNIFWTTNAEHFSTPAPTGGAQRVLLNTGDSDQNDNLSNDMGANEPATGRYPPQFANSPAKRDAIRQYVHRNVNGANAIKRNGDADCSNGQQGYPYGANQFDTTKDRFYKRAVVDQLLGLLDDKPKGPTFNKFDKGGKGIPGKLNRPRVPEGQTFTDIPGGRAELTEQFQAMLAARGQPKP
jgi:ABC-type transporter Mla subunit MlaD